MTDLLTAGRPRDTPPAPRRGGERTKVFARETERDPNAAVRAGQKLGAALADQGRPLPESTRTFFEHRFGRPLTDVRVHDDPRAFAAADSVGAEALTVGNHVLFAPGRFDPSRPAGMELLAHELAHTVQQAGVRPRPQMRLGIGARGSPLERQADAAAHLAMNAAPPGAAGAALTARATSPLISRRKIDWKPIPTGEIDVPGQPEKIKEWELESNQIARFKVPLLMLTNNKGPVLDHYQRAVAGSGDASALESTIQVTGDEPARVGLWEARARTEGLKDRWLAKVNWPKDEANKRWHDAGGKKRSFTNQPATGTGTCDMDHIIELQLGGSNTVTNIVPLNSQQNQASGREIWQYVSAIARGVRQAVPDKNGKVNIILSFQKVEQTPPAPVNSSPCCAPGSAQCTCADVDASAMQKKKAEDEAATAVGTGREPYRVTTGAQTAEFVVPSGKAAVALNDDANKFNSELIPCMILELLVRDKQVHTINALVESVDHPKRSSRTRLPLALGKGNDAVELESRLDGDVHRLKIKGGKDRINFTYPYLSKGYLDMRITDNGLEGEGRLDVTNPLFKGTRIDVYLRNGEFGGTVSFDPKKMKPPVPGLKITKAEGAITLAPELSVTGDIGFEMGKLVKGNLHAEPTLEGGGLGVYFRGDIKADIPKLEKAEGTVEYRNGAWSGRIDIDSGQLVNLPGSPRGNITVLITEQGGIDPAGTVTVTLPKAGDITCEVKRGGPNGIVFTGSTTIDLPGVKRTKLAIRYDGEHFSGSVKAGVDFKGLTGDIEVKYWDGAFSGSAKVGLTAGRFNGDVTININRRGELFGEGTVRAPLTEKITATLTVTKPEDGPWRVKGAIELPPTIKLFDPLQKRDTLFEKAFTMNIWGPIVIRFSAGVGYDVGIGPGTIDNAKVSAEFNPFTEETDLVVDASATLNVPAWAVLTGNFYAGTGVGAGRLGSLTVNVGIDVEAGVRGGISSAFNLHYATGVFAVESPVSVTGRIVFSAQPKGKLVAELLTAEVWSAEWGLGPKLEWDPGLAMTLTVPLKYRSDTGFTFPTFDQIERKGPDFDIDRLTSSLKDKLFEWA